MTAVRPNPPLIDVLILPYVAVPQDSDRGVVPVSVATPVDVAEPQASVDIAVAFDFLDLVFAVAVEVDSPGHPRFVAFPNID